ncbi:Glutamate-gated chloride channel [Toxocara canis]|uniref:Glutamate-gated chloride channel n=1 Tax=Toxocara canis TaxID=6265 RepID=A0A0B2V0I9_TOXCA|nr:Glutamate-gated chloride channel [Toxocara canis]
MRISALFWTLIVAVAFGHPQEEEEVQLDRRRAMQEAGIIDTILNGYNPNVRPIGNVLYEGFHRPVVVTVDLFIRSLKRVDDMKMQYDLHMTFRQKWRDDRLAYTNEGPDTVTLKDHHKIWIPDTFFLNEEEARRHVLEQPNTLIRVKRDGSVLYSTRLSMTLYCRMLFSALLLHDRCEAKCFQRIFLMSLKRVDDMKMQYDLHMTFRQKWRDDRLAYTNEGPDTVTLKDHHKIWIPDTFFLNEEEARRHVLEQPNTLIRVKRDGSVLYSTRLSMTLYCRMLFSKFPFDNQTCSFSIESYAYSEDDIVYAWDKDTAVKHAEDYAASVLFDITNITLEGGSSKAKQLNYSFIKALFHMQRKFCYYLYQFYIPTTMLVIVSWLAFFLHPSKTTARILIGFGTLALLIIASMLINRDVPKTSYAKAIDVWTGVTLLFVFLSLIETVLVSRLHSAEHECCDALISEPEEQLITPASKWNARKRQKNILCRICALLKGRGGKVDLISRLLFPVVFTVFMLLYFVVCWLLP